MSSQLAPIPVIVHLSGNKRGQTQRLSGDLIRIGTSADASVQVGPKPDFEGSIMANLVRRDSTYELIAEPGMACWVNGERTERAILESGDVLEIGRPGTVLRFRLYTDGSKAYKTIGQAFSDCAGCARHGASNPLARLAILVFGPAFELATQTQIVVRVTFMLMLAMTVTGGTTLWFQNRNLQTQVANQNARIDQLTIRLESESAKFDHADFVAAQAQVEGHYQDAIARLGILERRLGARSRVIGDAADSVVFLQGAYRLVQVETGRPMRVWLGSDGRPVPGPGGRLQTTLDGEGPIFDFLFTGTGFVVSDDGGILTNKHVATPWSVDRNAAAIAEQGFKAVMHRFRAYLPARETAYQVELLAIHPGADIALLRCTGIAGQVLPLTLKPKPPALGDEVIVLGYPTGMQALMARADPEYMARSMANGPLNFWQLAEKLAKGGYVLPLATVGVVGQLTKEFIVYDAETTHGGSGGPVLNLDGRVVAVNTAVLKEFGGSNLGVPANVAVSLLQGKSP